MEDFVKIFNKVNDNLVEKLEAEADKEFVELLDFTNYSSMDTVLGKIRNSVINVKVRVSELV